MKMAGGSGAGCESRTIVACDFSVLFSILSILFKLEIVFLCFQHILH